MGITDILILLGMLVCMFLITILTVYIVKNLYILTLMVIGLFKEGFSIKGIEDYINKEGKYERRG